MDKVSSAIKINFDAAHNPEAPTLILAKKNGDKLGKINAKAIEVSDNLNDASEITFTVYKEVDGNKDPLWDLIANFKLVYCVEWNCWFECTVEIDESNDTMKTVFCTRLGQAELSQLMLYNIEINTEADIERDDYVIPTVLYRENGVLGEGIAESDVKFYKEVCKEDMEFPFNDYKDASLLHRILRDKAPHYSVIHVDPYIMRMQREFSFDETSIYDACQEISEELNCLFVFDSCSDENGNIQRTISVYDLESNCRSCGYRGEFSDVCPECGSIDINDGFGEDTTIFVSSDEIAEDIQFTTDTDAVKNCFKLEAGDEYMTAVIRDCNPNGTDYIWYLSDDMKADMSSELIDKINDYDKLYAYYELAGVKLDDEFISKYGELIKEIKLDENLVVEYNKLVVKYNELMRRDEDDQFEDDPLEEIPVSIEDFRSLVNAHYNTLDMRQYLQSGLMPTINTSIPSMDEEFAKLTAKNLSPVAVNVESSSSNPLKSCSVSTVDGYVLSVAKTIIDPRYDIEIANGSTLGFYEMDDDGNYVLDEDGNKKYLIDSENKDKYKDGQYKYWRGNITLSVKSDDEIEPKTTDIIEIEVNDDYEVFVKNKINKVLFDEDKKVEDMSIASLFDKDLSVEGAGEQSFEDALKEYSLTRLKSFLDACQGCLNVMQEMGIANKDNDSWGKNIYEDLYLVYLDKLTAIQDEIAVRDAEIAIIVGVYDENGNLIRDGLKTVIEKEKARIQDALNFEKFLGEKLWLEFCSFRREDKYSNENYISEGLSNAEMISKANEFIETAKKDIYKSAELQCSIAANLKNLLVIEKFKPLVDNFRVGNWLRVMVDDKVYKIRLVSYTIDYDNLDSIPVEFSDVVRANSSIKSVKDVLEQASSMATSYPAVQRQAKQGEESKSTINDWFSSGLDATNVKIVGGADGQCQTWDSHGMLFREYDDVIGDYSPEQMKIINSTMAITTDNWKTTKTAVGKYYYNDPSDDNKLKMGYGINAEVIVGNLILSKEIGIYNEDKSIELDENGLVITVEESNSASTVFAINSKKEDGSTTPLMYVDSDGNLVLNGNVQNSEYFKVTKDGIITATSGTIGSLTIEEDCLYNDAMQLDSDRLILYDKNGRVAGDSLANAAMALSEGGLHLFQDNNHVGIFGTSYIVSYPSKYTLGIYLRKSGSVVGITSENDNGTFSNKLAYYREDVGQYKADTLYAGCNLNMNNYVIKNAWIDPNTGGADNGVTGTIDFIQVREMNDDGTVKQWTYDCKFVFKNGLLVDALAYWS